MGSRSQCAIIRNIGIGSWRTVHGADVKLSSSCRPTTDAILGGKPWATIAGARRRSEQQSIRPNEVEQQRRSGGMESYRIHSVWTRVDDDGGAILGRWCYWPPLMIDIGADVETPHFISFGGAVSASGFAAKARRRHATRHYQAPT